MTIPSLFKSKRFWVLVTSLLAYILQEETGLSIDVTAWSNIALAVIVGYSIEDWISAWNKGQPAPPSKEDAASLPKENL